MNPTSADSDSGLSGSVEESDETLLSRFLSGEEEMFTKLVRRYEQSLYAFIYRLSGDRADASDSFQETFVRVYQHGDRFRGDSRFKTWLYSIATNVCREQARKKLRKGVTGEAVDPNSPDSRPGPRMAAQSSEIGERIEVAVSALPDEQHEVFVMKVYEELTFQEISDVIDCPLGTVKSRMRNALKKVRTDLSDLAEAYDFS
ncbi:MAG: sigma-70 family RNA polymerase sigma factor [Planctomycetota bacterium]|jgi:RNA polymerase sigma-70 factor (ECF subfamily)|nr:sigma-70 family RNA polymerase sigma factor [Planctomycetota bacterium]